MVFSWSFLDYPTLFTFFHMQGFIVLFRRSIQRSLHCNFVVFSLSPKRLLSTKLKKIVFILFPVVLQYSDAF
jgi:hypothetical protein